MWQDTSESDGGADQGIELFISTDGELQVARSDTLDFEIFSGIACKLEYFGGQIFKDGSNVDSGYEKRVSLLRSTIFGGTAILLTFSTDSHLVLGVVLEKTLDTTTGELERTAICQHHLALLNGSAQSGVKVAT